MVVPGLSSDSTVCVVRSCRSCLIDRICICWRIVWLGPSFVASSNCAWLSPVFCRVLGVWQALTRDGHRLFVSVALCPLERTVFLQTRWGLLLVSILSRHRLAPAGPNCRLCLCVPWFLVRTHWVLGPKLCFWKFGQVTGLDFRCRVFSYCDLVFGTGHRPFCLVILACGGACSRSLPVPLSTWFVCDLPFAVVGNIANYYDLFKSQMSVWSPLRTVTTCLRPTWFWAFLCHRSCSFVRCHLATWKSKRLGAFSLLVLGITPPQPLLLMHLLLIVIFLYHPGFLDMALYRVPLLTVQKPFVVCRPISIALFPLVLSLV